MAPTQQKPEILVIVGETASGKSALALKVAKRFNGEIISADSWTVYKHFDIGTAKPNPKDLQKVRHHLISIVEPEEGFNAPRFKQLAQQAIEQIKDKGKLPIIAGGTGLYIDSLIFDYSFLPGSDSEKRNILNKLSINELLAKVEEEGISIERIDTRNKRRIIRAIESGGRLPQKSELREGTYLAGLRVEREKLRSNIEQRVENMFECGLTQEVKQLAKKYSWDTEPMKGIGYKEFRKYLEGEESIEATKKRIVANTMALAKRQRTWFKRNPSIHWFSSVETAYQEICSVLNT